MYSGSRSSADIRPTSCLRGLLNDPPVRHFSHLSPVKHDLPKSAVVSLVVAKSLRSPSPLVTLAHGTPGYLANSALILNFPDASNSAYPFAWTIPSPFRVTGKRLL